MYVFTKREIKDLIISAIAISIIVAYPYLNPIYIAYIFLVVGLGFIAHELAHKLVAQKHGAWSEYIMWPNGLLFSFLAKIAFGITIISPGATYWAKPFATEEEEAKVAAAGPYASLFISFIFLILSIFFPVLKIGAYINAFIAFFNLIPISPLDGSKIIRVKPIQWIFLIITSIVLMKISI